jgi:hypothetical protein
VDTIPGSFPSDAYRSLSCVVNRAALDASPRIAAMMLRVCRAWTFLRADERPNDSASLSAACASSNDPAFAIAYLRRASVRISALPDFRA